MSAVPGAPAPRRKKRVNIIRAHARAEELTVLEDSDFGARCVVVPILETWRIALTADDLSVLAAKLGSPVWRGAPTPAMIEAASKLAEAIIDEFGGVALEPDHEDYTHEDYLVGLALTVRAALTAPEGTSA